MASSPKTRGEPPAPEESELSLFGPGIGESVVIHLGERRWMVVDSCVDRKTGRPAALDYLSEIGVDAATQVDVVAVTHWHDDHMKGAAQVLRACESAQFICSAALRTNEFLTLVATSGSAFLTESGIDEFREILEIMRQRQSARRSASAGPDKWAMEGQLLHKSSTSQVWSLSPSHSTLTLAFNEFAALCPQKNAPKRRLVAQRPNAICTVLWVEVLTNRFLLGSDLEITKNPATGWAAVVDSNTRPTGGADVYKVAHHGSGNADDPRIWASLLRADPCAVLTPFRAGSKALPDAEDRARILARATRSFCTAAPRTSKTKLPDIAARRIAKQIAPDLRAIESEMGHVRVRIRGTDPARIELFGGARPLVETR